MIPAPEMYADTAFEDFKNAVLAMVTPAWTVDDQVRCVNLLMDQLRDLREEIDDSRYDDWEDVAAS